MSRRLTLAIFVGILGCLTVAAVTLLKIGIPLTQSDSASYIAWSPDRSPGYPFFVSLVAEMSPDYELLPPVQYLLLVAAVAAICDAFALLLRSPWPAFTLALAIFGNVFLMRYPGGIMADSLFISLVLAHVAFLLYAIDDPRRVWLGLSGLMLGFAVLVRPVGYSFLFALPWIAILWRKDRIRRTALVAIVAIAPIFLACLGNQLSRGYFGIQTLGNKVLVSSIAIMLPARIPGFDPAITSKTYDELRPLREGVQHAQNWEQRALARYFTAILGTPAGQVAIETVDANPSVWMTHSPYWRDLAIDRLSGQLARRIVWLKPWEFADKVFHEFYGLWFLVTLNTEANSTAAMDGFGQYGLQNLDLLQSAVKIVPTWAYILKFAILGAVALSSLSVIFAALVRRSPQLSALAYISISVQLYFLLIAGTGAAVPRYVMTIWPLQCVLVIGVPFLFFRRQAILAGSQVA